MFLFGHIVLCGWLSPSGDMPWKRSALGMQYVLYWFLPPCGVVIVPNTSSWTLWSYALVPSLPFPTTHVDDALLFQVPHVTAGFEVQFPVLTT